MAEAQDIADVFREFSRLHGRAHRAHENARHTQTRSPDDTLSAKQAIEQEFTRCFVMVKRPDWAAVEARAKGEDA